MKDCRECRTSFQPTPYEIRKSDFLCRNCRRKHQQAWRERRRAQGFHASGSDTWDPVKKAAWLKKYYARPDVKKRIAVQLRRYRQDPNLRERHMARWMLNRRVKTGEIQKQPCQECGKVEAQAHHHDYSLPLDVIWLCRDHHRAVHSKATGATL